MLTFPGSSKNSEHSVHSTGVPLSERFKSVPSHNPFRPNIGAKRIVAEYDDDDVVGVLPVPSISNVATRATFGSLQKSRGFGLGLGGGVNKLAVLRATKDAEILRLRAQLRSMQIKLNRLGNASAKYDDFKTGQGTFLKKRLNNPWVRKRSGGGVIVGRQGKQLTLQSASAVGALGFDKDNIDRILRDPQNSALSSKGPAKINFFGAPKSKEALDDELDKYMSKSKSKQKTDLDQELDEYMKHAKAQSFAGKVGLLPSTPPTPPAIEEPDDAEMEIVESL